MITIFEQYKNVYKIIATFWRRRYLIITSLIAVSIISSFAGFLIPNKYIATVNLLIEDPSNLNPYLKDMTVSNDTQKIEDVNARLHSQAILEKIAKELHLINSSTPLNKKSAVVGDLSGRLKLEKQVDNLFELQYTSSSTKDALANLNAISKVLINNLLVPDPTSLRGSDEFFQSQLVKKKEQLEIAEKNLSNFTTQNADSLPSFHTANVDKLHRIQEILTTKEIELNTAKSDLEDQQHQLIQLNPELAELDSKITQEQFDLALLREKKSVSPEAISEKVNTINQLIQQREDKLNQAKKVSVNQLEALQGQVASSATTNQQLPHSMLLSQLKNFQLADEKVDDLTREIGNLKEQIRNLEPDINEYGSRERSFSDLKMDLDIKRDMYQRLLDRYQKTRDMLDLGQYISQERVKVLTAPGLGLKTVGYPIILYIVCGIIGGALFGLGLALILDLFDTTIRYREQIEKSLRLPVLVRIPTL